MIVEKMSEEMAEKRDGKTAGKMSEEMAEKRDGKTAGKMSEEIATRKFFKRLRISIKRFMLSLNNGNKIKTFKYKRYYPLVV